MMHGAYNIKHICIIATGMIANCILEADFLDKFQVTISFKKQCMYTKDENGSRRHQFVSEEMTKAGLGDEAHFRGTGNCTVDGDERGSSCNNERKKERSLRVL